MKHANEGQLDLVWLTFILITLFVTHTLAHGTDVNGIEAKIVQSARQAGVSPSLALAIADVESGMNPDAVGALGEVGVFQLRPEYHSTGDVQQNIDAAIQYLVTLKTKCSGYGNAYFVCFNYGYARRLKRPDQFPYYRKVKLAEQRRLNEFAIARTDR